MNSYKKEFYINLSKYYLIKMILELQMSPAQYIAGMYESLSLYIVQFLYQGYTAKALSEEFMQCVKGMCYG